MQNFTFTSPPLLFFDHEKSSNEGSLCSVLLLAVQLCSVCICIFGLAALVATILVITMASTKHASQSTQTSPWRHHFMVRFIPILALGVISAVYLNGNGMNDDAQGRIGMDKLLNEPVLKDEPLLLNNYEPVLKGAEQKEQGVEVVPVMEETMNDSILLPVDPVAAPSTKSAKAKEGDPKSKAAKAKSKSKSAKAKEGAKAEKHDGKSKGAKSGKSKKSKAAKAKEEGASGKAAKGSAKAAKSKEKSKGGAKSVKKSAKATAEKLARKKLLRRRLNLNTTLLKMQSN